MVGVFDGLCALLGKRGACWQCKKLRDVYPEAKRGPEVPERIVDEGADANERWNARLRVLQDAELDSVPGTDEVHRVLFRYMSQLWDA